MSEELENNPALATGSDSESLSGSFDDGIEAPEVEQTAPEPGEQPESEPQKVEFDAAQQEKLNAIIAKKTAKMREAEQRAKDFEQRLKEAEAKLPKDARPSIPEMPDVYDENFSQKVAARDEAIQKAAAFDAQARFAQQQQEQLQQQKLQEQQQRLNDMVSSYSQNATKLGIGEQELANAGMVVQNYGLNDQIAELILQDEQGPLITKYLAVNPLAAEELVNTPLFYQGSKFDQIKANAANLQAKTSSAPPPADTLKGNGVPDTMPAILKGATFE